MRALFRLFALISVPANNRPVVSTPVREQTNGVKDLLELSEEEILNNLFTLDRPERLYTHDYAQNYIDPCPGEYGCSDGEPESFLIRVRNKIVSTIAGGLELDGASPVSRSDFEKAIELTTMLSSHAEPVLSGWNIYAIDQFTVGFDRYRDELYAKVEELNNTSDDRKLVAKLNDMVSVMKKASALVIA